MSTLAIGASVLAFAEPSAHAAPAPTQSSTPTGSAPTSTSDAHPLTASQLASYLRAAAFIRKVPADLTPSLSQPHTWGSPIVENGCQLSIIYLVMSQPCVYGDTNSSTSVVLFGDSHAGVWFPALDQISIQRHWRLLIFTKAGCSPPEVILYAQCNVWRTNSMAQIAAIHPAIVFLSWARWIEANARERWDKPHAHPMAGVPTGYGNPWLDGVAAIFKFLRRSAGRVIFISDVPTLNFGAAHCLSRHLTDVKPCNSTPLKAALFLPKIRANEFEIADRLGVAAIDPIPWFCSATTCPVLVRNFMVYYDSAHMTPPWSLFIAPVFDRAIGAILSQHQSARRS